MSSYKMLNNGQAPDKSNKFLTVSPQTAEHEPCGTWNRNRYIINPNLLCRWRFDTFSNMILDDAEICHISDHIDTDGIEIVDGIIDNQFKFSFIEGQSKNTPALSQCFKTFTLSRWVSIPYTTWGSAPIITDFSTSMGMRGYSSQYPASYIGFGSVGTYITYRLEVYPNVSNPSLPDYYETILAVIHYYRASYPIGSQMGTLNVGPIPYTGSLGRRYLGHLYPSQVHLALSVDMDDIVTLYKNGLPIASAAGPKYPLYVSKESYYFMLLEGIRTSYATYPLDKIYLDDARLYSVMLSDSEVSDLYNTRI